MASLRITAKATGVDRMFALVRGKLDYVKAPFKVSSDGIERATRRGVDDQFRVGGIPAWRRAHPLGSWQPAGITLGGIGSRIHRAWQRASWKAGPRSGRLILNDRIAAHHHRGGRVRHPNPAASQRAIAAKVAPGPPPRQSTLRSGLVTPARPVRITEQAKADAVVVVLGDLQRA